MSKTTFNKQIRALRICRWPYRKRNSLQWLAGEVEAALVRPKPSLIPNPNMGSKRV